MSSNVKLRRTWSTRFEYQMLLCDTDRDSPNAWLLFPQHKYSAYSKYPDGYSPKYIYVSKWCIVGHLSET